MSHRKQLGFDQEKCTTKNYTGVA